MRYVVKGGEGASNGVRVAAAGPTEALAAARSMIASGLRNVEMVDDAASLTLAEFSRRHLGHSLTPEQVELIAGTADVLISVGPQLAGFFYARVFLAAPSVRSLFRNDLGNQQRKLADTLTALVEQITHPAMFVRLVAGLAHRHVAYGAKPEHYPVVGEALLATLGDMLGPRFTPEVRDAWATLYGDVSATMMAAAGPKGAGDPLPGPGEGGRPEPWPKRGRGG